MQKYQKIQSAPKRPESNKLALVILRDPDIVFFLKHVIFLDFVEASIIIFYQDLRFVFAEEVLLNTAHTWISDENTGFLVILQLVSYDSYIVITD